MANIKGQIPTLEHSSTRILAIHDTLTNGDSCSPSSHDPDQDLSHIITQTPSDDTSNYEDLKKSPDDADASPTSFLSTYHGLDDLPCNILLVMFLLISVILLMIYSLNCVHAITQIQRMSVKLTNVHRSDRVIAVGEHVHRAHASAESHEGRARAFLSALDTIPELSRDLTRDMYFAENDDPYITSNESTQAGKDEFSWNVDVFSLIREHLIPWTHIPSHLTTRSSSIYTIDIVFALGLSTLLTVVVMLRENKEVI